MMVGQNKSSKDGTSAFEEIAMDIFISQDLETAQINMWHIYCICKY